MINLIKKHMLPAYLISKTPLILITYWNDFIVNKKTFMYKIKNKKGAVIFQLGWHYCTKVEMIKLKKQLNELQKDFPNMKFIFFVNSKDDIEMFDSFNIRSVFCHQNAFIDESKIQLITKHSKKYKAVYLARVSPFKRHYLCNLVEDVLYIGDYKKEELNYAVTTMKKSLKKTWIRKTHYSNLSKLFSQSRVGLCLSETEGAMFASTEYQLAGIPVISTQSNGGRDSLFNNKYCKIVEDDENKIRDEVSSLIKFNHNPHNIRKAVLLLMSLHRSHCIDFINLLILELSDGPVKLKWSNVFIHKWGLRSFSFSFKYFNNRLWFFKF